MCSCRVYKCCPHGKSPTILGKVPQFHKLIFMRYTHAMESYLNKSRTPQWNGGESKICAICSDGVLGSLVLLISPTLKTLSMLLATTQKVLLMMYVGEIVVQMKICANGSDEVLGSIVLFISRTLKTLLVLFATAAVFYET